MLNLFLALRAAPQNTLHNGRPSPRAGRAYRGLDRRTKNIGTLGALVSRAFLNEAQSIMVSLLGPVLE